MNESRRRVASIALAVLSVAVLVACAARSVSAGPPEGKTGATSEFTVKAKLVRFGWTSLWIGDFAATGAIKDRGDADFSYAILDPAGWLMLYGEKGNIEISIADGSFRVIAGTLSYANLPASGSANERHPKPDKLSLTLEGNVKSPDP